MRTSGCGQRKKNYEATRTRGNCKGWRCQRAVHDMTGVTVEALKLNFKRDELPGLSRIVIMERKKKNNGCEVDFQGAG